MNGITITQNDKIFTMFVVITVLILFTLCLLAGLMNGVDDDLSTKTPTVVETPTPFLSATLEAIETMAASRNGLDLDELRGLLEEWQLSPEQLKQIEELINARGVVTYDDLTHIAKTEMATAQVATVVAQTATAVYESNPCYIHIKSDDYPGVFIRAWPHEDAIPYGAVHDVNMRANFINGPMNDPSSWWLVDLTFEGNRDQVIASKKWQIFGGHEQKTEGWISNSVVYTLDQTRCSLVPIIPGTSNPP